MGIKEAHSTVASQEIAGHAPIDWNKVYTEELPRVYNYFRFRIGRQQSDIEDLTARTFEKAWKARDRYRRDLAGFSTWLFEIARNVATDHLRARRTHLPLEAAQEVPFDSTPELEVSRRSDIARLIELMAGLSEQQRELLALKYGAAINNRLIAKLTGLSESNVGTILSRLVEKLRSQW
jgi:RNA polymerase sigma-70 factor (ECF subfamily)